MANAIFVGPPSPPTRITINGKDEADGLATKATNSVDIGYDISGPYTSGHWNKVRAVFHISIDNFQTSWRLTSDWFFSGKGPYFLPGDNRFHITLSGLSQNTLYKVRAFTQTGGPDQLSNNYNSFNFWTNRPPNLPELVTPTENQVFLTTSPITYDWKFSDPDPNESQVNFELRWREVRDDVLPGPFAVTGGGSATTAIVAGSNYQPNLNYEWQVRVSDGRLFSDWSLTRSFYVKGGQSPPVLRSPVSDTAVDVSAPIQFVWQFRDPESGDSQHHADLRYRVVGEVDWTTVAGASADSTNYYTLPSDYLLPEYHYEWQVQTYDVGSGGGVPSEWSASAFFFGIARPGRLAEETPLIDFDVIRGSLGCGNNRVYVYQQGGRVRVGEITSIQQVIWRRQRDDISNCVVDTSGFDSDCGDLLKNLRCWQHELVVFRDGVRVWEGPITRLTYTADNVEVEAKDVMGYLYRRIMRQGYNDSYNCLAYDSAGNCVIQTGLNTVVYRASRIITDAFGRGDPNVLPYLTIIHNANDARQSRVLPDFAKTAWEEVDDLASSAGLDYVTVGRRIILFDTHYPIGKLPEMRDGDFTDPVVVSEYGMNLCNYYGVTDGSGIWGAAVPVGRTLDNYKDFYGPVELLSSSYGDSDTDSTDVSTPAAVQSLRERYAVQASRNIGNRWPTPLIVRVPDNTSIKPEVNIDINHLIPGVWIPLRSTASLREVSQWQKLDTVTVTQTGSSETVQVVMGPAPHGGLDDPDAENTATET